jgi:hypothetical protein
LSPQEALAGENQDDAIDGFAPAIVRATIEGRLPRGIGIAQLRDGPPGWSDQFKQLGLPPFLNRSLQSGTILGAHHRLLQRGV